VINKFFFFFFFCGRAKIFGSALLQPARSVGVSDLSTASCKMKKALTLCAVSQKLVMIRHMLQDAELLLNSM